MLYAVLPLAAFGAPAPVHYITQVFTQTSSTFNIQN